MQIFNVGDHRHSNNLSPFAASKETRRSQTECLANLCVNGHRVHIDHFCSSSVLVSRLPGDDQLCHFQGIFKLLPHHFCLSWDRASWCLSFLLVGCFEWGGSHFVAQATPPIPDSLTSVSLVLCLEVCTTIPDSFFLIISYSWSRTSFLLHSYWFDLL